MHCHRNPDMGQADMGQDRRNAAVIGVDLRGRPGTSGGRNCHWCRHLRLDADQMRVAVVDALPIAGAACQPLPPAIM